MKNELEAESAYLFVIVVLTYRDFRKRDHKRELKYVWDRRTWAFSDYETTKTAPHEAEHDNPKLRHYPQSINITQAKISVL